MERFTLHLKTDNYKINLAIHQNYRISLRDLPSSPLYGDNSPFTIQTARTKQDKASKTKPRIPAGTRCGGPYVQHLKANNFRISLWALPGRLSLGSPYMQNLKIFGMELELPFAESKTHSRNGSDCHTTCDTRRQPRKCAPSRIRRPKKIKGAASEPVP